MRERDVKLNLQDWAIDRIIKRVEKEFPEVKEGFDTWECGFWNGVLGTLRWVLGDEEKDNLDTQVNCND